MHTEALTSRMKSWLFWIGIVVVAASVAMHLPAYVRSAALNFCLAGNGMDTAMLTGMAAILPGTLASGVALIQPAIKSRVPSVRVSMPPRVEFAKLNAAHWGLMLTLALALVIDVMKPATLGFVMPGTIHEYHLTRQEAALLPLSGLTGTAIGSYVWGILADRTGRRGAILLAGIMFIGTSICGALPGFWGNLVMCGMMGLSAGGMLPIAYTLLAETIPARHRGWCLVLIGGIGLAGGYLAASTAAVLANPVAAGALLIGRFGAETKGRRLEDLDDNAALAATA